MKPATLGLVLALVGCSKTGYVADGPLARPLTQFNGIRIRAVTNKVPATPGAMKTPPPPADTFIQTFQQDLTNRLHRKKVLHYASGPTLTLEASLLQYDCESRSPSYEKDLLTNKGTIALEIVLTDESGRRIGGGRATMTGAGSSPENAMKETQKKLVAAIGEYLKKSARGNEPDPPGSDDP